MNRIYEYKGTIGGESVLGYYDLEAIDAIGVRGGELVVNVGGSEWLTILPQETHVQFIEMWKGWKEGKR